MLFCEKCGGIIIPKKDGKCKELVCSKCNHKFGDTEKTSLKEEMKNERTIAIIEKDVTTLPKTEMECPKCGHAEAYFWLQQMRAGDEAETQFFECTNCKHRWRKSD